MELVLRTMGFGAHLLLHFAFVHDKALGAANRLPLGVSNGRSRAIAGGVVGAVFLLNAIALWLI
jgi:hypothetical protein